MEYKNRTIGQYNELLAQRKSVPGGGSALAMTLSLACSLCLMVVRFTLDKKGYEPLKEKMEGFEEELNRFREEAYAYADEDSRAFSALMEAFRTGESKRIEEASEKASLVPYRLYLLTERVQVIADELFLIGNKNVVSDAKIASDLCYSIYPGCRLNIEANKKNIRDAEFLNRLNSILE